MRKHLPAQDIVSFLESYRFSARGQGYSSKARSERIKWMNSLLESKDGYSEIEYRHGRLTKAIVAVPSENDFGDPILKVIPFVLPLESGRKLDPQSLDAAISRLTAHAKTIRGKTRPKFLELFLLPDQSREIELLRDLGAELDFYELLGKTQEALNWLQKNQPKKAAAFTLSRMEYKTNIAEILRFETKTHGAEPTSRVKLSTKRAREKLAQFYKTACSGKNMVHLIRDGKKLIGLIAISFRGKDGIIGSISVHPDYQSLGIGRRLYLLALQEFVDRKCEFWAGGTSTDTVLHLAKKMKRQIHGSGWRLNLRN